MFDLRSSLICIALLTAGLTIGETKPTHRTVVDSVPVPTKAAPSHFGIPSWLINRTILFCRRQHLFRIPTKWISSGVNISNWVRWPDLKSFARRPFAWRLEIAVKRYGLNDSGAEFREKVT